MAILTLQTLQGNQWVRIIRFLPPAWEPPGFVLDVVRRVVSSHNLSKTDFAVAATREASLRVIQWEIREIALAVLDLHTRLIGTGFWLCRKLPDNSLTRDYRPGDPIRLGANECFVLLYDFVTGKKLTESDGMLAVMEELERTLRARELSESHGLSAVM